MSKCQVAPHGAVASSCHNHEARGGGVEATVQVSTQCCIQCVPIAAARKRETNPPVMAARTLASSPFLSPDMQRWFRSYVRTVIRTDLSMASQSFCCTYDISRQVCGTYIAYECDCQARYVAHPPRASFQADDRGKGERGKHRAMHLCMCV